MHKSKSVLKNKTHVILWNFDIQMDHRIPTRRADLVLISRNGKTYHQMNIAVRANHKVKMEGIKEIAKKYLELAWEMEKSVKLK